MKKKMHVTKKDTKITMEHYIKPQNEIVKMVILDITKHSKNKKLR
jgi:hypothetical protein